MAVDAPPRPSGLILPGDERFVIPDRREEQRRSAGALSRAHAMASEMRRFDAHRHRAAGFSELPPIMGGAAHPTYIVYNSAMVTTAAPVAQPTGTAIRTMMQLKPASVASGGSDVLLIPIAWGISFDGSTAATPGKVELVQTDVAATSLSTAYAAADIQPYGDWNTPANAGASATTELPLNRGTSASGFSTGAVTEGTITATRMADVHLIAPTNQFDMQWPLGREFMVKPGLFLRVRVTFAATVNMICYVIFEV